MKAKQSKFVGRRKRQKGRSRPAKGILRRSRRQTGPKSPVARKSRPGRPALGSLVQSLPWPDYQPNQFVLPYIGQIGKVVGYQKNYNSVKVKFADGFTLSHNPNNLRRAG